MPSSHFGHVSALLAEVLATKPPITSALDAGVGWGRWGMLLREALDVYAGRVYRAEWRLRLDGVEVWQPYLDAWPWLAGIYSSILHGNVAALDLAACYPEGHDLVVAGDVLEHLTREAGERVLRALHAHARRLLLVSLPLGGGWLNNVVVAGNDYERHRAAWTAADVDRVLPGRVIDRRYTLPRGEAALFGWRKP
jgi:hypothetical protein